MRRHRSITTPFYRFGLCHPTYRFPSSSFVVVKKDRPCKNPPLPTNYEIPSVLESLKPRLFFLQKYTRNSGTVLCSLVAEERNSPEGRYLTAIQT